MKRNGLDQGSNELLLLVVTKDESQPGSGALSVSDTSAQREDAIGWLQAEQALCAFAEGQGEAGQQTGVAQIETAARDRGRCFRPECVEGPVSCSVEELDSEITVKARKPVKKGIHVRHIREGCCSDVTPSGDERRATFGGEGVS